MIIYVDKDLHIYTALAAADSMEHDILILLWCVLQLSRYGHVLGD